MDSKILKKLFKKDIKEHIPKVLQSNKTVCQMLSKIKSQYTKKEIVDYFRTLDEGSFIFLTEENDLFLYDEKLDSFDDWLLSTLHLAIFSKAHEIYENFIVKSFSKDEQLSLAKDMKKSKKISKEQYLFIIEIINCRTDIIAKKS